MSTPQSDPNNLFLLRVGQNHGPIVKTICQTLLQSCNVPQPNYDEILQEAKTVRGDQVYTTAYPSGGLRFKSD